MNNKMDICKTCGAEIAKTAKTCPQCGAKHKKVPVWGIILIVIGVFCLIGAFSGSDDEPKKVNNATVETSQTDEITTNKTGSFGVGESAEYHDVVVTLSNVTETKGNGFLVPSDGNVFVNCEFLIENNSDSDIAVSSMLSFEAYVDDFSTTVSISAMSSSDKTQLDGTVAAGKKMSGIVGYEVPADWSELEVRFTPNVWSGSDIVFTYVK